MKNILFSIIFLAAYPIHSFCCTSAINIVATAPASDTVCTQTPVQYTATATDNGGANDTYQWMVNGIAVNNATGATFTYPPVIGDVVTCTLTNTCGTVTSNSLYPIIKTALDQVPAQTFCGGYTTTPVKLYGASWTNNNASIGLPANGTGDIPAFIAINNGPAPVTAIVTAIQTCTTIDTAIFPIIINPVYITNPVVNQAVCAGDTTFTIYFSGPVTNTIFNWTSSNTSIGIPASGTDSIASFTGLNTGSTPIIDTITVTPFTNGYAYMTDAINGNAYAVSRATNNLVDIISGVTGFWSFSTGIAVSSDGRWVYISNNQYSTVSVISAANDSLVNTINVGNGPWGIVISPDGNHVYVANNYDATVSVISTATGTVTHTISLPASSSPSGIAISPDGSRVYVASATDTGMLYFINATTNTILDSVTVGNTPIAVIVSPDGNKVYTANYLGLNISTVVVSTKEVSTSPPFSATIPNQPESNGLALSPDGLTLYVSSFWDGTVTYYNTNTNPPNLLGTINLPGGGGEAPVGLSMSSDGQYLYVSNCGNGYYPSNYSSLDVISTSTKTVASSNVIVNPGGEEVSYSMGNFVSGIACTGAPYTFTITVNPVGGVASVDLAITSGSQTSCSGSPVVFTADATNIATGATFNFMVNGVSMQNGTSSTFTTTSLNNSDTVTCAMTGNTCGEISTVTSNGIIMSVSPPLIGNISSTTDSICQGGNAAITIHANTDSLQWQSSLDANNFADITGARDSIYTAAPDQATYYRVYASNKNCSDTSGVVELSVKPVQSPPSLTATDSIICSGDSAQVCVLNGFAAYQWNTGDTTNCTKATAAGGYWVTVTTLNGCTVTSQHKEISEYPVSSVSIIVQGDTLSSFGAVSYQWYLNGQLIQGATSDLYVANIPGSYTVEVTNTYGCTSISSAVVVTGVSDLAQEHFLLYPNPSTGTWQLEVGNELIGSKLVVYDSQGQAILQSMIREQQSEITLNVSSGLYWLRISSDNSTTIRKLLKI